jgi:hypothetical protein
MTNLTYFKDLAERAALSYVTAFLGLLLAAGLDYADVSTLKASALAAGPAVLQVLYGGVASLVGNPASAGLVDTREKTAGH